MSATICKASRAQALPHAIDTEGWLTPGRQCPSPNFDARPPNTPVSLLVVHNMSLPPHQFGGGYIEAFFCNQLDPAQDPYFASIAHMKVSAHCLIDREGQVTQFVSFLQRAWHAGRSAFRGQAECNDYSVGIELEGVDNLPYTDAQYASLACVARLLCGYFPELSAERVVGHSDIAPTRKTDPGPAFDWPRLREQLNAPSI